jgi:hypothetical protein
MDIMLTVTIAELDALVEQLRTWQQAGCPAQQAKDLADRVNNTKASLSPLFDTLSELAKSLKKRL